MSQPIVFISYSHHDQDWKDRLIKHLKVLQMQKYLELWHDRQIPEGENWKEKIYAAMARASVAILMISPNFLTSEFILEIEIPFLLNRREKENLCIFPILIEPCAWKYVKWLASMQVRLIKDSPLSTRSKKEVESELASIAEEVGLRLGLKGYDFD